MEKMSPDTFKERFGDNTAIAALAVIVGDEEKDKKRLIHDATHGVRVNRRIKCRDKLLVLEAMDRKEYPFSIVGDIKKAHRHFKHMAEEHGFLACQLDSREGRRQLLRLRQQGRHVWGQLCQLLVDPDSCLWSQGHPGSCPIDMLLCADDLKSLATTKRGRIAIVLSYCYLTALGYPFKWSKNRGGYRVEWLGVETEYSSYCLGLTERRASWLVAASRLRRWLKALAG